jgi:hypothetical protein
MCVRVRVSVCVCMRIGGIYSSTATATCACCVCHRPVARVAAGVSWTSRTSSAPWDARDGQTTVIGAAGAIYVIGGYSGRYASGGDILYNDIWVSTDGGAGRTRAGVLKG